MKVEKDPGKKKGLRMGSGIACCVQKERSGGAVGVVVSPKKYPTVVSGGVHPPPAVLGIQEKKSGKLVERSAGEHWRCNRDGQGWTEWH